MNMIVVLGILRHLLTTFGGALVTDGYVTDGDFKSIVGAIMTIVGISWSIYEKYREKNQERTRLLTREGGNSATHEGD